MIQETQRCEQTTWIQKRKNRRPLEVHSPETNNRRSHLAVNRFSNQYATRKTVKRRSHYVTEMMTMEAYHNDHPNSGQVRFAVNTTNARKQNHATEKITNNRCALQNNNDVHHRIRILPSLESRATCHQKKTSSSVNVDCPNYLVPNVPNNRNQEACHTETQWSRHTN